MGSGTSKQKAIVSKMIEEQNIHINTLETTHQQSTKGPTSGPVMATPPPTVSSKIV